MNTQIERKPTTITFQRVEGEIKKKLRPHTPFAFVINGKPTTDYLVNYGSHWYVLIDGEHHDLSTVSPYVEDAKEDAINLYVYLDC